MKLPSVIMQVGETDGESRVYIEDYAYSYLKELKSRKDGAGSRAVLFGQICDKEHEKKYFIYGAACETEEFIRGRDEEQIREIFFPDWEKIGYVNIPGGNSPKPEKRSGYCIFYDSNEGMQNYLLSCYNRETAEDVSLEEKEKLKDIWMKGQRKGRCFIGSFFQKLLCALAVFLLGIAITTIDEYHEMYGFVEAAERAVWVSNLQGQRVGDK